MQISFLDTIANFQPWKPELGQVYQNLYSIHIATSNIGLNHPRIAPVYILSGVYDGKHGYFLTRENVYDFMTIHQDIEIIFHDAPSNLAMLECLLLREEKDIDVYRLIDENRLYDTQLLHRLFMLASEGHTARGEDEATLERCSQDYLQIPLAMTSIAPQRNENRLSFDKWLGRPPQEIEPEYLRSLAETAVLTFHLKHEILGRIWNLLQGSSSVWGYPPGIMNQIWKFGYLTHHIQLKGAVALKKVTENGLCVDLDSTESLQAELDFLELELKHQLLAKGFNPDGKGSSQALQKQLKKLNASIHFIVSLKLIMERMSLHRKLCKSWLIMNHS
ncbi:Hypothetical protein PBC10988_2450 [Planctomycetales bacterium 10988]|nr:Hypothetical protein PBC10988_2450 [Planctomycetales bacterium 10988]